MEAGQVYILLVEQDTEQQQEAGAGRRAENEPQRVAQHRLHESGYSARTM